MVECRPFENELREALNHLYDPLFLRKSPLVRLFGLHEQINPAAALRNRLEQAIKATRPEPGSPPTSRSERNYQILFHRYVQQFTQRHVANQLGISPRHLRREQTGAIQALAEYLRGRFDVSQGLERSHLAGPDADRFQGNTVGLHQEMAWLGDSLADHVSEVKPVLKEALRLINAVASQHNVAVDLSLTEHMPRVAIAQTVLKQVALSLLATAIASVPGGRVSLIAEIQQGQVTMDVRAFPDPQGAWRQLERDGVDMARRLVELFKGRLVESQGDGPLRVKVVLPSAEQVVVLAIEDNADTLQLWERYVQDTRFRLMGARDPEQAFRMATELRPSLIILDVMLPGVDGWELLGQLRHHPLTGAIPVVVCTVLPQKELALSLGARGFIRKPVTRQSFRALLARHIGVSAPA